MEIIGKTIKSKNLWRIVLINLGFLFFIVYWYTEEWNLLLVSTVIFLSSLYMLTPEYFREILFFTVTFPIVEIICILFGVWQYSVTSILVVPLWLFPAWGQVSVTIIYMSKNLQKVINNA